jgi:hypothetical protein
MILALAELVQLKYQPHNFHILKTFAHYQYTIIHETFIDMDAQRGLLQHFFMKYTNKHNAAINFAFHQVY